MTAPTFETALSKPDCDASHAELCTLIATRDSRAPTLPKVAQSYLQAFYDTTQSVVRRRWVGIALAGMMDHSPTVGAHLRQLGEELQQLGDIILSSTDHEETKIVAGIIVRQGLDQGIAYGSFWKSEKVRNSTPNFPDKPDPRWMSKFQTFLDTLGELALTNPVIEPSIIYPISLVASDGFRWRDPSSGLPVAILQAGVLTIVAPDKDLAEVQFVDLPVSHIQCIRSEPSKLHDSQAQQTTYEPWDLTLILEAKPWTYRLNSAQRTATNMSLVFEHSSDATEWKSCIEEHQNMQKVHPNISRSSPMNASFSSLRNPKTQNSLHPGNRSSQVDQSAVEEPMMTGSGPIASPSRPQLPHIASQLSSVNTSLQSQTSSKRGTQSKGKLPSISQATKWKALKRPQAQSDDFDMPSERHEEKESDLSDPTSSTRSSPKKSQRPKTARVRGSVKGIRARRSQTKYKSDDDEDFIPAGLRPKRKSNAKRKSVSDAAIDGNQAKKARIKPSDATRVTAGAPKRQMKPQSPIHPPSSLLLQRHPLIGGLFGSQVPFKKPKLSTRAVETSSTPTKPLTRPEALVRPQTPTTTQRRPHAEALPAIFSSPPVNHVVQDRSDWIRQNAPEAGILSSNSKPVPASPNAESTAISSHADCENVASEKRTGDSQTAKSNPFSQRAEGQKKTSFIRRLTGEESTIPRSNSKTCFPLSLPTRRDDSSNSEVEALIIATQKLSQPMPWQKNRFSPKGARTSNAQHRREAAQSGMSSIRANFGASQIACTSKQICESMGDTNTKNLQMLRGEVTPSTREKNDDMDADINLSSTQNACIEVTRQQEAEPNLCHNDEWPGVKCSESILTATRQVIDDTPAEHPAQGNDMDMEGNTIADDYDGDAQSATKMQASPVNFRSSPPMPGSPSSHSSTSAPSEPASESRLPSSQAEEMEWEESLQPHQRALHDLLVRTSKRVVRHIVENETGVADIAQTFAVDGEHVLKSLLERHDVDYDRVFRDLESKKKRLQGELEYVAKQMAKERRRASAMV
ncbi:hypothetical protein BDW02DRAFT_573689 [Decorospora gaudefroyi]|uniref:Uncharacterized protein n=1 Tax=Decorospora gaudefroyi TaxID=184978 RepID=A0A6A5K4W1_9PLEO|nr:hypothetical protein BDW02DRAFT_573689 [Decorospora gaudefroyi]